MTSGVTSCLGVRVKCLMGKNISMSHQRNLMMIITKCCSWKKSTVRFYFCFIVARDGISHLNECFVLISAIKTISHFACPEDAFITAICQKPSHSPSCQAPGLRGAQMKRALSLREGWCRSDQTVFFVLHKSYYTVCSENLFRGFKSMSKRERGRWVNPLMK